MAGKLTKAQRIYAREKLIKAQKGKCNVCGEAIHDLLPGVVLAENWRRAVLYEKNGRLHLGCQPCATDILMGIDEKVEADLDAVDALLTA